MAREINQQYPQSGKSAAEIVGLVFLAAAVSIILFLFVRVIIAEQSDPDNLPHHRELREALDSVALSPSCTLQVKLFRKILLQR